MTQTYAAVQSPFATEAFPLKGIAYVELWVGNAQQAAHFYASTFGFAPVGYAGPETGLDDQISYLLQQGDIRLVFSSATRASHPISQYVSRHGDSVRDVALAVDDVDQLFERALRYGAQALEEPTAISGPHSQVRRASICAYGDTVHTLIQRDQQADTFFPLFQPLASRSMPAPIGLTVVDHIASCLEVGTLEQVAEFYIQAFGFHPLHQEMVATELSAMNSKAVEDGSGQIKFVLMEPAPSKRRSQIEDYLIANEGAGAQHIATLTNDIIATIRGLRDNGISFRSTPGAYYDMLSERVGDLATDMNALRELHILADRDEWGYLLQIFARPTQARQTLFFEIIQREGARGFGSGNIKALFESIEREQTLQKTR